MHHQTEPPCTKTIPVNSPFSIKVRPCTQNVQRPRHGLQGKDWAEHVYNLEAAWSSDFMKINPADSDRAFLTLLTTTSPPHKKVKTLVNEGISDRQQRLVGLGNTG